MKYCRRGDLRCLAGASHVPARVDPLPRLTRILLKHHCAPQILIWFTQDRASTRDAAHRALPCHARSRSHQDYDETLALASIQRLEDPARLVRAPCVGERDCNERSTISGHDAGALPRAV